MDHNLQDRATREQFIMLLPNTTTVVLITIGFMTFGVWHERDSGIAGAENLAIPKRESSNVIKVRNDTPILRQSVGYPVKREIFEMCPTAATSFFFLGGGMSYLVLVVR